MTNQQLQEVLPKAGLVYSEKSTLSEILSKPKIMPLKSITLEKLEEMEENAKKVFADSRPATSSQRPATANSTSGSDRPSSSQGRPTSSAGIERPSSHSGREQEQPQSASHRPSSSAGLKKDNPMGQSVSRMAQSNYGASGYGAPAAARGGSSSQSMGSSTTEPNILSTPGNTQEVEEVDDEEMKAPAKQERRSSAPLTRPASASQSLVRSASARPTSSSGKPARDQLQTVAPMDSGDPSSTEDATEEDAENI